MGKYEEDPEFVIRYKQEASGHVEKIISVRAKFVVDATGKASYPFHLICIHLFGSSLFFVFFILFNED